AAETARRIFVEGGLGQDLPVIEIDRAELDKRIPTERLFHRAGLVSSNSEGRRLMKEGGARVNDVIVREGHSTSSSDVTSMNVIKLSFGKKKHAIVRVK
ncbi:MAG: tyrosine--tRNA ligase, partial [Dongiaceae bacterium]